MSTMSDPLIDLRDFAFLPLDVVRLRDSELVSTATGDEFRAAVHLGELGIETGIVVSHE